MADLEAQTFSFYRGERVVQPFSSTPNENITGWTLVFTVTTEVDKPVKKIGPLAVTIVDASIGDYNVVLEEEQTNLKPGTYAWDVWRTDEGFEECKAIGSMIVIGNSNRPPVT